MIDFEKWIKNACEKKHIRESQFRDFLGAFGNSMIEREAEKFIQYCESDGWHYWSTDVELPTSSQK